MQDAADGKIGGESRGETHDLEADLALPLGEPGSGLRRYAAAMALWAAGRMDAQTLERYRICARWDHEDPALADPPPARDREPR